MNPELSIVVPVYKEQDNIGPFLERTLSVLASCTSNFEIIFCLDPSPDRSYEILVGHSQVDPRIKILEFSRRVGQQMATLAGLEHSRGENVVVMDVDMQDPPELIAEMLRKRKEGYEVVYAQRRTREGEPIGRKLVAYFGYRLINLVADVHIPRDTGDFRLMSRRVAQHVVSLKENHGFLRGMVALVGFKQTAVMFDRKPRLSGKSHYGSVIGSLRLGFNGVFCFSNYALTLSTTFGFITAGSSFVLGITYAVLTLMGVPFPLGNPTLVLLITFLGGIQMITIGIMGEYIGRIYDEVKRRPRYILSQKVGFGPG